MSRSMIPWTVRQVPLVPKAVAAQGTTAKALARRLLRQSDETLATLWGATDRDLMVLLCDDSANLPWVDGVFYLGKDSQAPTLLLPTTTMPAVPLALFERALQDRFANLAPPIAVLPAGETIVPLGGRVRPVERARLQRWLEATP